MLDLTTDLDNNDFHIIAYHDNCTDGFTAGYIVRKYIRWKTPQVPIDAEPVSYEAKSLYKLYERVEEVVGYGQGRVVLWVVDFSLSIEELAKYKNEYMLGELKINIIDHHETALREYNKEYCQSAAPVTQIMVQDGIVNIMMDKSESGASLACKLLYEIEDDYDLPWLVKYVKDADLFLFEYGEDTKYMAAYLANLGKDFTSWGIAYDDLSEGGTRYRILTIGANLKRQTDRVCRSIADKATRTEMYGHITYICQGVEEYRTILGSMLARDDYGDYTLALVYYPISTSGKYKVSLRSHPDSDIDC